MDLLLPLQVSNGQLVMVSDAAEIAQRIGQRLAVYRGEWFLDTQVGAPYHEQILGAAQNSAAIAAVLRAEVAKDPAVIQVPSVVVTFGSRGMSAKITALITTSGGVGSLSISLDTLPDGVIVVGGVAVTVGGVPIVVTL
jgi:hypothetical protein